MIELFWCIITLDIWIFISCTAYICLQHFKSKIIPPQCIFWILFIFGMLIAIDVIEYITYTSIQIEGKTITFPYPIFYDVYNDDVIIFTFKNLFLFLIIVHFLLFLILILVGISYCFEDECYQIYVQCKECCYDISKKFNDNEEKYNSIHSNDDIEEKN